MTVYRNKVIKSSKNVKKKGKIAKWGANNPPLHLTFEAKKSKIDIL